MKHLENMAQLTEKLKPLSPPRYGEFRGGLEKAVRLRMENTGLDYASFGNARFWFVDDVLNWTPKAQAWDSDAVLSDATRTILGFHIG